MFFFVGSDVEGDPIWTHRAITRRNELRDGQQIKYLLGISQVLEHENAFPPLRNFKCTFRLP